jgi:putative membrane protein
MKTDLKKTMPLLASLLALAAPLLAPAQNQPAETTKEERSASPSRQEPSNGRIVTKEDRGLLSNEDYRFVTEAARAGLFEVQAAELARSQATSPAVKDFAERIITDHGKANQELKRLAQKKDATLPTTLSSKEERGLDHLRKASVRDFDKVYAQHMVEEHQHDLNKFRRAAEHADDPDLKSFAQGASVMIEDHLLAAKDLQEYIRLESGARSGD